MLTKNYKLKCDYCGRFAKTADFENNTAKNICHQKFDWYYEDVYEDYETYHVACKKKHERYRVKLIK